jgi:phosphoribosylformylglycinamidine cyclo-ligase
MGHRLEIFTDAARAESMIKVGKELGIEGKIVGRVEAADHKQLLLRAGDEEIVY